MTPIRPLLANLLSLAILIGHAPAWLHHAGCHHHGGHAAVGSCCATVSDITIGPERCELVSEGCCGHCSQAAEPATSSDVDSVSRQALVRTVLGSGDPLHHHDESSCPACQSLSGVDGLLADADIVAIEFVVGCPAKVLVETPPRGERGDPNRLRGPPVFTASVS